MTIDFENICLSVMDTFPQFSETEVSKIVAHIHDANRSYVENLDMATRTASLVAKMLNERQS